MTDTEVMEKQRNWVTVSCLLLARGSLQARVVEEKRAVVAASFHLEPMRGPLSGLIYSYRWKPSSLTYPTPFGERSSH